MESTKTIEDYTSFSNSMIWDLQRNFFKQKGIHAWDKKVPYYVTSNMLIAHHYAQTLCAFFQDSIKSSNHLKDEPFYIFELGAGTGKFSFYMVKQLLNIMTALQLPCSFVYVITDISIENINYWQKHSQFKPFFKSGVLDIALLDIENPGDSFNLLYSGKTLKKGDFNRPISFIGNYVFDSIKNDCFHINSNSIEEVKIKISSDSPISTDTPDALSKCSFSFDNFKLSQHHYTSTIFNEILQYYCNHLQNTSLLFPISALKFIDQMKEISDNNLVFILGDKGHQSLSDLKNLEVPHISSHGSISFMTNFNAIGQYTTQQGGCMLSSALTHSFKVNLLHFGETPLTQTNHTFSTFFNALNPGNYLTLKNSLLKAKSDNSLDYIISIIEMSYFDPDIYFDLHDSISKKLAQASSRDTKNVRITLDLISENYYYLPFGKNILFALANNFYIIEDYLTALTLYLESLKDFENDYTVFFNIGLCYYATKDYDNSLKFFRRAHESDATDNTLQWINHIEEELSRWKS